MSDFASSSHTMLTASEKPGLIGYEGLIIEEDQLSGGICSVLVWRNEGVQSLS